jgi:adenylate cyclase
MSENGSTDTPAPERKLAAILAADVEGYSRLMHADEERTLAVLTAHRDIIDKLILAAHGEIFATAGDSVLAEFSSVVEAFHCAVAIQQALAKANAALPEDERMQLRIGLNVGDVMMRNGDVFGDGVNVAARVESLAEPGGICITRVARDQLRDRVDARFEDIGEHSVKNISRPIRAFRVIFDPHAEPHLPGNAQAALPASEETSEEAESSTDPAEIAFWESVRASDDDGEYRIYLERYPEGAFAALARTRLHGPAEKEEPGIELAYWETVRDRGDARMLRAYLEKYPQGEFRALAEIMLSDLEKASR